MKQHKSLKLQEFLKLGSAASNSQLVFGLDGQEIPKDAGPSPGRCFQTYLKHDHTLIVCGFLESKSQTFCIFKLH